MNNCKNIYKAILKPKMMVFEKGLNFTFLEHKINKYQNQKIIIKGY